MDSALRAVLLGVVLAAAGSVATPAQPLLNEFMASNATTIADDDGDYSDWIELYNAGATAYDLTDHYLSDDSDNPLRWQFPTGTIPALGYLLVWASGKDRVGPGGDLHTNFAISASGEPLLLTAPDGVTRLDEIEPRALETDISYGRLPDGADHWTEFVEATPGAPNEQGLPALAAPSFSEAPGFYTDPIALVMSALDPQALITYTLDGSEPTLASPAYTEPLLLDSRAGDPNTISLIPTNFRPPEHLHGWRPPRGEVFKINVVRARAFRPGYAPSRITTGSYVVDPELAARVPLPLVSLAVEPDHFFADDAGIYVPGDAYVPGNHWTGNYFLTGPDWERPLHIEFFDLAGQSILAQDAGARIHGGFTRTLPQKTLRMYARSAYGPSRFQAALFPELPYDSYNRFLIRNSGSDWAQAAFRDFALQTVFREMGFDTQAGRAVVHFVNGEYWGLANLRERYDRHYLERCHAVPGDDVALLVDNAELEEGLPSDREDYLALRSFVLSSDMTQPANLAHVAAQMDLENFMNYCIAEIYGANHDWPGNNVRFWRLRTPAGDPDAPPAHDGRWRWLMYDLDDGFLFADRNTLAHATAPDSPSWQNPPWSTALLRGLLENPWFRQAFINTFADHLNSTFKTGRVLGIIDEFADLYAPAIGAWHDRWDIVNSWPGIVNMMRAFAHNRPQHQREHIREHFDLAGFGTLVVDVNDPAMGAVQLNQLVIDADLAGLADPANPYPWVGSYFQGVPVTATALPASGYRLLGWQEHDTNESTITIDPGPDLIRVTAVFALDPYQHIPVHAWHFNDLPDGTLTEVAADLSLAGAAVLTYPGTGPGYLDRVNDGSLLGALPDTPAGHALRARNPSDTRHLHLRLPTGGHVEPKLSLAAWRTVNGAQEMTLEYSLTADAAIWHQLGETVVLTQEPALHAWDFAAIETASDNPDFQVRLSFGGSNAGGSSGNTRHDNIVLFARPLVADPSAVPTTPRLTAPELRIYPNPFNPACTIRYVVPRGGPATLEIFDLRGRRVRTLLAMSHVEAGPGTAIWAGTDDHGRHLSSGNYLCRLVTIDGVVTRKIQLLK
jgi:hypothetical protein